MKIVLTSYRVPFGLYNIIVASTNKISSTQWKIKIYPKKQPNERSKYTQKTKKKQQRCLLYKNWNICSFQNWSIHKSFSLHKCFVFRNVSQDLTCHKILHVVSVLPTIKKNKNWGRFLVFTFKVKGLRWKDFLNKGPWGMKVKGPKFWSFFQLRVLLDLTTFLGGDFD
jgi:hypothetical protein